MAKLEVEVELVDTGCPSCRKWFWFHLSLGDQKCPWCGQKLRARDVLAALGKVVASLLEVC